MLVHCVLDRLQASLIKVDSLSASDRRNQNSFLKGPLQVCCAHCFSRQILDYHFVVTLIGKASLVWSESRHIEARQSKSVLLQCAPDTFLWFTSTWTARGPASSACKVFSGWTAYVLRRHRGRRRKKRRARSGKKGTMHL